MPTSQDQIRRQLGRARNPDASAFMRLAASGIPGLSDLVAAQRATGGNRLFAQEQNQANQQRASAGAFDAYNRFQLSNQGNINNLLGLLQGGEQFGQELDFRRDQFQDFQRARRADRGFNFINSLLGVGGAYVGQYLGNRLGAPPSRTSPVGPGLFSFGLNPRTNPGNPYTAPVGIMGSTGSRF